MWLPSPATNQSEFLGERTMTAIETQSDSTTLLSKQLQDWSSYHETELQSDERLKRLTVEHSSILLFALSPVQEFIEASRSLRDLWSGSLILSKLVRKVIEKVESLGGLIIYPRKPSRKKASSYPNSETSPETTRKTSPQGMGEIALTPHRFLAVVPDTDADENPTDFDAKCRDAFSEAWLEVSGKVRIHLAERVQSAALARGANASWFQEWDKRWEQQVESCWETRIVTVPLSAQKLPNDLIAQALGGMFFSDRFPELTILKRTATLLELEHADETGRWQILTQLANRLLSAQHPVRYLNRQTPVTLPKLSESTPHKCRMFGSFETIGPDRYTDSKAFWSQLQKNSQLRLKKGEEFCALGLIKRLAPHCEGWQLPTFTDNFRLAAARWLQTKVPVGEGKTKVPNGESNMVTVAEILKKDVSEWDGHWLHVKCLDDQATLDQKEQFEKFQSNLQSIAQKVTTKPPVYYAVLLMDADNCHQRLAGKTLPYLRSERKLVEESQTWSPDIDVDDVLSCRRPLTPTYHMEISERQSQFGKDVVPEVIGQHEGQLIYNGGDEFLALLPVTDVFDAATKIRQRFSEDQYFGYAGTMSAGIAIAHCTTDLRAVLQEARDMMALAKSRGRNFCQVSFSKRSGGTVKTACPWELAPLFRALVAAFRDPDQGNGDVKASDNWLTRLQRDWQTTLQAFDTDDMEVHPAIIARLSQYVSHSDQKTQQRLLKEFQQLRELLPSLNRIDARQSAEAADVLSDFVRLYVATVAPRLQRETYRTVMAAVGQFFDMCDIAVSCAGKESS
ncbi:MAG: type III-B CRISPR-associated protein Cas10/Cmr2 [Planctomyces sp.]|nr:type III-B CRISPR-associated protein Cas10/Cmr2 [Planctomyces sp.]